MSMGLIFEKKKSKKDVSHEREKTRPLFQESSLWMEGQIETFEQVSLWLIVAKEKEKVTDELVFHDVMEW